MYVILNVRTESLYHMGTMKAQTTCISSHFEYGPHCHLKNHLDAISILNTRGPGQVV